MLRPNLIRQKLTSCIFQCIGIINKPEYEHSSTEHWHFPAVNLLGMHVFHTFFYVYLKILNSSQWEGLLKHSVMGR